MSNPTRVAIVSYTDAENDPRIRKQIQALHNVYSVTVIAVYPPTSFPGVRFLKIEVPVKKKKGMSERLLTILRSIVSPVRQHFKNSLQTQLIAHLRREGFEAIIANDLTLPSCVEYGKQAKVVFDAHEYYLDDQKGIRFRLANARPRRKLLQRYMPLASQLITVSEGLATLYEALVDIRPVVIPNTVWYVNQEPRFRDSSESTIRLVHHGGGMYRRKIDRLIQVAALLDDRFEMDLMLVIRDDSYRRYLQTLIDQSSGRVRLVEPVKLTEVSSKLNEYDVGVHMLWGESANHRFAMPNKLFEFVQARIAVAVSPNPDMAAFVKKHGIGVVASELSVPAMADALNSLSHDEINELKANSAKIAETFSAERAQDQYREIVDRVLS